ncbi:MAG: lamin tail domain-containing protein [Candidatus Hydrogenedentota bacterium]|nr:lamin tail domain-containing protein [Candidatus Sumerlaea chitinivorans]RMH29759.1 MAG: lamin tail domain-containing protein [Candidatus Hydrogenedentota bacterium]GIX45587.1 MAG: hypothetical protein KatS3mg130_1995 [Candidatus Sumerlaea sp.]
MKLSRNEERGSTLIVVAALLSVLLLMVAMLSMSAKMDMVASRNYAEATEARAATIGAFPRALAYVSEATTLTSLLQPWNSVANARPEKQVSANKNLNGKAALTYGADNPLAQLSITDLGSKVNVNAFRSKRALARFLAAVFPQSTTGVPVEARAHALASILDLREDNSTTRELDLRLPPTTNGRRIQSLWELLADPAKTPDLFSYEELLALANYATCFSLAPEVFTTADGASWPKTPLAGLTPQRAYEALRRAFPEKDERLLRQYSVNLADFLDADDVPTLMTDPQHPEPWNTLIGLEETPLITEVYPDAATSVGGDEGQFVEIYNPWNHPITMTNWRLVVGGTEGRSILLNTTLPPKGFLILTDNYETPRQETPPSTGCFLAIFGARRDEAQRQLIEVPSLNLPDKNSFVSLLDDRGNLIDVFSYTDTAQENSEQSYQRSDPTVRAFLVAKATPFELPEGGTSKTLRTTALIETVRKELRADRSEGKGLAWLLYIPTSYVGFERSDGRNRFKAALWQMPDRRVAGQRGQQGAATNLDARVLDVFTVEELRPRPAASNDNQLVGLDEARKVSSVKQSPSASETTAYAYGRLNLNTCSKQALYALDAEANGINLLPPEVIHQIEQYRIQRYSAGEPPFRNLSEFVAAFFANVEPDALPALDKLLSQVTVSSAAFEIVAETRPPALEATKDSRAPAVVLAKWTVALDFAPWALLDFRVKP